MSYPPLKRARRIIRPLAQQLDSGVTTSLYALDMGVMFLILAYFTHEITIEDKKLIPKELLRSYKLQRSTILITAALFIVSTLPLFWSLNVFHLQVRFILWMGTFLTFIIRREIERREKH